MFIGGDGHGVGGCKEEISWFLDECYDGTGLPVPESGGYKRGIWAGGRSYKDYWAKIQYKKSALKNCIIFSLIS